jgi:hypothetical protein
MHYGDHKIKTVKILIQISKTEERCMKWIPVFTAIMPAYSWQSEALVRNGGNSK